MNATAVLLVLVLVSLLCGHANANNAEIMNVDGDIVMTPTANGSVMTGGDVYVRGQKLATENVVDEKITQNCDCSAPSGGTAVSAVFADLHIDSQTSLEIFSRFSTVETIGSLNLNTQIDSPLFTKITSVGRTLQVFDTSVRVNFLYALDLFSGLSAVGNALEFNSVDSLLTLNGSFPSLRKIEGTLVVKSNANLQDLNGFRNLTTVGGVSIVSNPLLGDLNGLSGIQNITGGTLLDIDRNPNAFICSSVMTRLKSFVSSPGVLDVREDPC